MHFFTYGRISTPQAKSSGSIDDMHGLVAAILSLSLQNFDKLKMKLNIYHVLFQIAQHAVVNLRDSHRG